MPPASSPDTSCRSTAASGRLRPNDLRPRHRRRRAPRGWRTRPQVMASRPLFMRTDTCGTRASGRNGACACGGPAGTAAGRVMLEACLRHDRAPKRARRCLTLRVRYHGTTGSVPGDRRSSVVEWCLTRRFRHLRERQEETAVAGGTRPFGDTPFPLDSTACPLTTMLAHVIPYPPIWLRRCFARQSRQGRTAGGVGDQASSVV